MTTVYPSTFFKKSGVFSTLYKLHVSRHIEKTDPETTRDEKTYFSANATPRARGYEAPTVARAPATQHHSHHDAYPDADAESENEPTPRPADHSTTTTTRTTTRTIERAVAEERYDAYHRIKSRSHANPGFEHFNLELDFCGGLLEKQTRSTEYTPRTHQQGESSSSSLLARCARLTTTKQTTTPSEKRMPRVITA